MVSKFVSLSFSARTKETAYPHLNMNSSIRKNIVPVLVALVLVLIVLSTILVFYNRKVMIQTTQQQELSELTLVKADFILNNLQAIDLGLRGFAVTRHQSHLGHYKQALAETGPAFKELETLLDQQNFKPAEFHKLKEAMAAYAVFCNQIVDAIHKDSVNQVREMISMDKGYDAWFTYQEFFKKLSEFEKGLTTQAQEDYDTASSNSIWTMVILLTVSLPTLFLIVYLLRRAERKRRQLFQELEENNRKFNFNPGTPIDIRKEYQLIDGYIENSKKAADFVNQVTAGKYDVDWEGLNAENRELNQENLAGALVKMRDQMKTVKLEEEKRLWVTKGLAEFSELIRNHQENIEALAYESVVFLVKYLKAQQGGLFVVNTEDEKAKDLELVACYAFDRKKFINRRIQIGEGLIGQAYLEADTIFLTEVPEGYTIIRSGLGDATPACLLIVPMKYNDEVQAIIEIASFVVYEPYQVEFLEKIGEFVASAVATVQTNQITKRLLVEAQSMGEEMKAQEEEMRQNMEELSATQEEMHRKEREYINRIQELEIQLNEKEQQ